MKKIISVVIICLLCVNINVFADELTTFEVESKEAYAGDKVQLNIELKNNTGILSLLFNLNYDSEKVKLIFWLLLLL